MNEHAHTSVRTLLEGVLEHAPLLCIGLDAESRVVVANDFARTLLGSNPVGQRFGQVVVDFSGTLAPHEIAARREPARLVNFPTHSGLPQTLTCTFLEVEGHILVIGAIDVAEQEAFRKEILSLNQQLGNLTRELQQSNAELARLNALKNQFLGMATHDLRKPAGIITSYSEFLLDEGSNALNDEQSGFLRRIHENSMFMQRLIDDFLDVAMIESGQLRLEITAVDVRTLVDRAAGVVDLHARMKGVPLEIDIGPISARILADESKLEQVLMNLTSNAVEHSEPGSAVHVRAHQTPGAIVFEVEDHGEGMSSDDIARLFNPYVRAGTKKTAGERSTGLGLAISRKIVEAHGGSIEVDSTPGKGSVFYATIPLQM